jgi:segregation and condensation protein A
MQEKIVPWWRRALQFALGGIRARFGLFSRPAEKVPAAALEEINFIDKLIESLEVETVLTKQPNPETLPAAAESVAAPNPSAEPVPSPAIDAELLPSDAVNPIDPVDPAEANATTDEPDESASVAESAPETEPVAAEPQAAPVTQPAAAAPEPSPVSNAVAPIAPAAAATEPDPVPETPPPTPKPYIKMESRDDEANLSPFSVVVEQVYDGPLDLLLDLIRKQDIDIYDIPIAKITAQFLAYVNQLKASDVDVAGEFIYIASLLIHIKSKMLLPRMPAGPEEAVDDPRRELVERLLEHERFKNAAQMLQQKQMLEAATWTNPGFREFQDDIAAEPEIAADTVDLVRIFRDILERIRSRPVFDVDEDAVTVGQMIQFLARRLTMEDKPVALRRLLSHARSERALIAIFLALLELVRLQAVLLRQDRQFSEIFIKKHTGFDAVMNEGLANARDDWQ